MQKNSAKMYVKCIFRNGKTYAKTNAKNMRNSFKKKRKKKKKKKIQKLQKYMGNTFS